MKPHGDSGAQGAPGPTPQHRLLATTDGAPEGVLSSLPPAKNQSSPISCDPGKLRALTRRQ